MSIAFHEGNRRLQDQFASRRIADRLDAVNTRTAFTDNDKAFIESRILFFLATADAAGRPTLNHTARPASCASSRRTSSSFPTMTATACSSTSATSR